MGKIEKLFDETTALIKKPEIIKGDKLSHRLTNPYKPITQVQDRVFPAPDALFYENQLVAILDAGTSGAEVNFVLCNGNTS